MNKLDRENLRRHIAIIMDGNGRWARKRLLNRINGHRKGIAVAKDIVKACRELGIPYLTLYTFSKENWRRPASEVKMLMALLESHLRKEADEMVREGIRFKAIGNIASLPPGVQKVLEEIEKKTRNNDSMVLQLALSYSGREEILEACKKIVEEVKSGRLSVEELSEDGFRDYLYTRDIPDPDLLIRTSGECRISNFLLWQLAYTEIYITDILWPDFTREALLEAIRDFQTRERRFGLVKDEERRRVSG